MNSCVNLAALVQVLTDIEKIVLGHQQEEIKSFEYSVYNNSRPATFTVSLGGLFFAFPEQILFVAVHLVLFFFGQALALFASFV